MGDKSKAMGNVAQQQSRRQASGQGQNQVRMRHILMKYDIR